MGFRTVIRFVSTSLTVIALSFAFSTPVLANGLAVSLSGDYLGTIVPATGTPVSIESEDLSIRFEESNDIFLPIWMRADVSVTYQLRNPTDDTLVLNILFVGDFVKGNRLTLDGKTLPFTAEADRVSLLSLDALDISASFTWLDPWTNKPYPLPERARRDSLDAIPFTLELTPGTHELRVEMENALGMDQERYLNRVFHLTYLLHPAKYWAHFGDLTIQVELPHDRYRLASSLPLSRVDTRNWATALKGLPEQDLHLSVVPTSGMWLGRFTTKTSIWLLLAAVTLLPEIYRRLLRSRVSGLLRPGLDVALRVVAIWFAWDTLTRGLLTAPFNGLVQIPVLAGIIIWLVWGLVKDVRSTPASDRKAG